jgi:cytoskeleton protein RodZ
VDNEVAEPAPIPEPVEVAAVPAAPEPTPIPEPVEAAAIPAAPEPAPMPEPVEVAAIPAVPETQSVGPSQARVLGNENGDSRIVVRAKINSWIQIRDDVANQLLVTRLLRAGDSYHVPNRSGLKLLTGNAGALEIMVDGVLAPPIGLVGAVRRDVALDAESLMAGTAVRQ